MNHNPKRNASGCRDMTAYHALKPIFDRDKEIERRVHKLIAVVKNIADLAGFEVVGRVEFRHKSTGREFK